MQEERPTQAHRREDAGPADPTVEADRADPASPGPGDSEGVRPDLLEPDDREDEETTEAPEETGL